MVSAASWDVERRTDGALLVRVHSAQRDGERLPDAVFTFRCGDPQFEYWESQWQTRCDRSERRPSEPWSACSECR